MKVCALTQKGPLKEENEDRIVIGKSILASGTCQSDESVNLIAIADGVGGNNAGSVASHYIACRLTQTECADEDDFKTLNNDLLSLSMEKAEYRGMASTLSGIRILADHAEVFSVGNTRVYLLQCRKYLKQITSDDTTLNYLLATGQLSAEDSDKFERKNEITACFGGGSENLFRIKVQSIDALAVPFMLTSDGVHDYVSSDRMEDIIFECGLTLKACEQLASEARSNGSNDDISIVMGEV